MVKQDDLHRFLSADDVEKGKKVTFLDEGRYVSPEETGFKDKVFEITTELPNKEQRVWTMNKTSRRMVAEKHGDDSKNWVGKQADLETTEVDVKGKKKKAIFVVGEEEGPKIEPATA